MRLNLRKYKIDFKRIMQLLLMIIIIFPTEILAGISIENALSHLYEAKGGEKYSGTIIVKNSDDKATKVNIYKKDYSFTSDGKSNYAQPGTLDRSNANWITIVPEVITIPANDKVKINYIVQTPVSEDLRGSYWSMIMVEKVVDPRLTDEGADDVSVGIFLSTRYGIQIVTNVGNTGEKKLKLIKTNIKTNNKKNFLVVDVENIGIMFLKAGVYAEFYNNDGEYIGKFSAENKKRIYPNTSVRYKININDVSSGEYQLLVVADGGENALFGAKYTITIK